MKRTNNTFVKNALLTVMTVLVLTSAAMGQSEKNAYPEFKEYSIKNLNIGIKSENDGLRKSSIYFAGLYQVSEAVDALVDQFKAEKNSNNRVLIALVLYKIGNEKGMDAIYTAAVKDDDLKVKRICSAIAEEYNANKTVVTLNDGI